VHPATRTGKPGEVYGTLAANLRAIKNSLEKVNFFAFFSKVPVFSSVKES
jgi:hypothetical protein